MSKGKRLRIDGPIKNEYTSSEIRGLLSGEKVDPFKDKPLPPVKENLFKAKVDHVTDPDTGQDVRFQSRREANLFRSLLNCREAEDPDYRVVKIERQVCYRIEVAGRHICKYYLDFKVHYASGRIRHVDSKGYRNPKSLSFQLFRVKKEIVEALYNITIELQ